MQELLDRLKQIDPTTYKRLKQFVLFEDGDIKNTIDILSYGEGPGLEAILQACLQDAILAKGWHFQLICREESCMADITTFGTKCDIIDGPERKTPAEAMLAAYIEACEAMQ